MYLTRKREAKTTIDKLKASFASRKIWACLALNAEDEDHRQQGCCGSYQDCNLDVPDNLPRVDWVDLRAEHGNQFVGFHAFVSRAINAVRIFSPR